MKMEDSSMTISISEWLETALSYAPVIMFDQNEPFYPDFVGVSVIEHSGPSPSFRRELQFPSGSGPVCY